VLIIEEVSILKSVSIEFPEEVVELYGEEELKKSVRKLSVLELVKRGKLSSGKAAEILEMTRWDFMELMSDYDIPMANFPPEELREQAKERGLI
jgi:predicted HTH domain antitoxin